MHEPDPHAWWVVVPVKGGPSAKSRLRASLDDATLVAAIVHDTLAVATSVVGSARVVVVTGDAHETEYARAEGHAVVADPGAGIDGACLVGVEHALGHGALRVAVLLGDHPALTPVELTAALKAGSRHTTCFVPDADGTGTALLATTAGVAPEVSFGAGSAARHEGLGHTRLDLDLPGLRHDVDDEASLAERAVQRTLGPRTRHALGR
ncbi:2-phospho-L-lactate guanylyltransferase [Knoellia subterranea]|uniref:2-phospho-L-lactate guanylyltransferase n=1 Tax=Knoellia subterranea KCTC 19937 TaxID=1385521 RepID=A0A0A0JHV3_9MICO|nr:2-phospho-L-lactate guanylyltransferase [Knoellia subterranea]KGN36703.1 2-phospho-L-lactate guanylyltransferase [Knoellia subterranea KCTC 19937]